MSRRTATIAALAAASLALVGCSAGGGAAADDLGSEANPVRLGVVGAAEEYWQTYVDAVKADGISIELVDFTDYAQPNPSLSAGDLDINQFQHIIYLADYNVAADDDLTPIGATAIYPLGLYSSKYDSTSAIPDGETVIVPDDDTNQARGLLILQAAGLVKLKDGGSPFSTLDDVIKDESRVTVQSVDAALTVGSLPDVAAAIVNNDFLLDAGLTASDAIAVDDPADPSAQPYINVFATRAVDADNEVLRRLVEIYQGNQQVLDGVQQTAGGTAQFVQTPASDLQASLATVEADIREQ